MLVKFLDGSSRKVADLSAADLRGAILRGAKGLEQQTICPAGTLYGYKKLADNQVITLLILTTAKRLNAYGSRKCRAEFAFVHNMKGVSQSRHESTFKYRIGETVRPVEPFCDDPRIECASGIHFYITKEEAEAHE